MRSLHQDLKRNRPWRDVLEIPYKIGPKLAFNGNINRFRTGIDMVMPGMGMNLIPTIMARKLRSEVG